MLRRAVYALVGVSLAACAAATTSTRPTFASASRDVITAAEIVASRVTDVYQAVHQLRPEFLRRRPVRPMQPTANVSVAVYLDDLPYGGADALRDIPLERVRVIRFLNAHEADLRWGGHHPAGAILVSTMR